MNAPSAVELEVQRLRALAAAGKYAPLLAGTQALVARVPENRDVLLLHALAQRQLRDIPAALATLDTIERLYPRFSRLYQERGQCYVALRQAPEAIAAFQQGVHINPALPVSWSMLEGLYRIAGEPHEAAQAAAHVATLNKLPPEVVTATALFSDGEFAEAELLVRAFLVRHGHHVEGMRLLARLGIERDALDDAQLLLEGVLDVAPDYDAARFEYAQVLSKRQMHQQAQEQVEKLLAAEPANRNYRTLHAMTCIGLGQNERAVELYRGLLTDAPRPAELHLSIAHSLKTLGERDEAIAEYRQAASVREGYGEAYWSLANLKTYRFEDSELAYMRAAEAGDQIALADRYHLCFALGKALEDRGDYAGSFAYYARGNAPEARRVPLPSRGDRAQYPASAAGVHG